MKKIHLQSMDDVEGWIDALSYEEAAKVRKLAGDRMEREKGAAKEKLMAEFQERLALYDLSPAELGLGGGRGRKSAAESKRATASGPCGICGFETSPPHDGRKHRSQGDDKKPFTVRELNELEMKRV